MPSPRDDFNELMERVKQGRELTHASFEPIYYLVFPPSQMLSIKRELPAWTAKLRNEGWDVTRFSIAEAVSDLVTQAPLRKLWVDADRKAPLNWKKTNGAITNYLERGVLKSRLEETLAALDGRKNAILLVTDLEALHPYMRIGQIEGELEASSVCPPFSSTQGSAPGRPA